MTRTGSVVVGVVTAALVGACDLGSTGDLDLDALPELSVREELRLGSVDDPEVGFSSIAKVDVDRDGRVYVFERGDMQIRVYAPDGTPLRRIGRRGEGPGEFQAPIFGVVGDTVWAYDVRLGRITLFGRDGTLLSTARSEPIQVGLWTGCFAQVVPLEMRPDGLFTTHAGVMSCARDRGPELAATDSVPVPRLLVDAAGRVVDTLGWDDRPPPGLARPPSEESGHSQFLRVGSAMYLVPYPPGDLVSWLEQSDGRIEVAPQRPAASDGALSILRIAVDRDTTWRREYRYTATPIPGAELDSLAEDAAANTPFGGGDPAAAGRIRSEMWFPDFRPATDLQYLDDDGRIWLHRYEPPGPASHWAVLDAEGLPLGALELPGRARFKWSGGSTLIVEEPDDLDVPWLVRYRIEGL